MNGAGPDDSSRLLLSAIYARLDGIKDPCSVAASVPMGLDEMGLVKRVELDAEGRVEIELRLTSPFCEMIGYFRNEIIEKIGALDGITSVYFLHDSGMDWDHDMIAAPARRRREARLSTLREMWSTLEMAGRS